MSGRIGSSSSRSLLVLGILILAPAARGGQIIGELTDPQQLGKEEFVDIISAWIEQDGGQLTFVIETRGNIPEALGQPEDYVTYLWLVDADNNAATGQNHGTLGSEFNVRAVISEIYGGGWVDVTGSMAGGGVGTVIVVDNRIQITIGLGQIANPSTFHWRCNAFHVVNNICVSTNYETAIEVAIPLPYVPPSRVTVTTPLLMLSPSGPATGMLEVELRDAAGNLLDNTGYHFLYPSSNEAVATVDEAGLVTAHAVPVEFWETPYVDVSADGVPADSAAVIRVTDVDLGVIHNTYSGKHVAFYLPAEIEGVDLEAITMEHQVVRATDLAYEAQQRLTGVTPFRGGVHWFVLDVTDDPVTVPCGLSGNPVRLGWEFGNPVHNSCYIVNWPGDRVPQFSVIFHEMGHNFTWPSWGFGQFCSTGSPHDWKYSEALASMAGAWTWDALKRRRCGLSSSVIDEIARGYPNIDPGGRGALADYRAAGAIYDDVSVEVICDIFWELYDSCGSQFWFDFFSTFTPVDEALPVMLDNAAKQATWVAAAASASAGTDLRGLFAAEYGFPIDDGAWPEILAAVESRIAARPWHPPVDADFDCDGDVDGSDASFFEACTSGPMIPYPGGCDLADFDTDADVDQFDFGSFQRCYSGEDQPVDPTCVE